MNKEVKVGLLVVISGVILYLGFNFLKGKDFFSNSQNFFIQFDNIDGLTISNPVILNGYRVGRVDGIEILHDKDDSLLVSIAVGGDVIVNDKTYAKLASSDLLGGKSIMLHINNGTTVLESGAYIKGKKKESLTDVIKAEALPVISTASSLMTNLDSLTGNDNRDEIAKIIESFGKTSKYIEISTARLANILVQNQSNINQISKDLVTISGELGNTIKSLDPLVNNMTGFSDSLNHLEVNKTLDAANQSLLALKEMTNQLNSEEGTVGQLLNSSELSDNLNITLRDVDYLVTDMQANPKRYIQFSIIGGTSKNEKAIVKKMRPKKDAISGKVVVDLKRPAPPELVIKVYKKDRTVIEINPVGLGSKQISFDFPSELVPGEYNLKLDWDEGSESFPVTKI